MYQQLALNHFHLYKVRGIEGKLILVGGTQRKMMPSYRLEFGSVKR